MPIYRKLERRARPTGGLIESFHDAAEESK